MAIVEGLAGGSSPKALRLSSAFAPLPAKLVEKIQSGHVGPSVFCSLCQEADHHASNCALAFFHAPPSQCPPQLGHVAAVAQQSQYSASLLPTPKPTICPETLERICVLE